MNDDAVFMRRAIDLALDRMGETWPNPAVGCVIVKDGVVLSEAATAPGGRPHAEEQAVPAAGAEVEGATAYVTLNPAAPGLRVGPPAPNSSPKRRSPGWSWRLLIPRPSPPDAAPNACVRQGFWSRQA